MCRIKLQRNLEQRYAIKFCVKLDKSATDTFKTLTDTYGDDTLSRAQVFRLHKAFKNSREHVKDKKRSGRPSTSKINENVKRVKAVTLTERQV